MRFCPFGERRTDANPRMNRRKIAIWTSARNIRESKPCIQVKAPRCRCAVPVASLELKRHRKRFFFFLECPTKLGVAAWLEDAAMQLGEEGSYFGTVGGHVFLPNVTGEGRRAPDFAEGRDASPEFLLVSGSASVFWFRSRGHSPQRLQWPLTADSAGRLRLLSRPERTALPRHFRKPEAPPRTIYFYSQASDYWLSPQASPLPQNASGLPRRKSDVAWKTGVSTGVAQWCLVRHLRFSF